jgi:hypothetical protein
VDGRAPRSWIDFAGKSARATQPVTHFGTISTVNFKDSPFIRFTLYV